MRIAITGAAGQLGQALYRMLAAGHELVPLGHDNLELEQPGCVQTLVATGAQLVIHPAAYTNVDGCARDPDRAYRVNGLGTRYVALACQLLDAPLVYVSTNEVFDGAADSPYLEYDRAAPINPYGRSKWAGEQAVRELLHRFYIVRVAWLFGGARNFVRTVLRLAGERTQIAMVADEIGSPTYAPDAAAAIARLIETPYYGTYHLVNEGVCSRYDLASATLRLAGRTDVALQRMALADYQRASAVPPYTPLRNLAAADLGIRLRPWEEALAEYLREISSVH
ncbi:MAG: dTDP-4-dehydrorhamnose reductase [Chloroflexi bacterium]|nr:dTDP-4-dehydrorhamnose reductase [Chloroflexota bacterium]